VASKRLPRPGSLRPIEIAPDWICEVLSPATAARDRVHKRNLYARSAIPHYWLIDPAARVLEALSLRDGVWLEVGVYDDTSVARIPPFELIELEVGRLFLPKDADEGTGEELQPVQEWPRPAAYRIFVASSFLR
jgi:Uma2 family endonuclease